MNRLLLLCGLVLGLSATVLRAENAPDEAQSIPWSQEFSFSRLPSELSKQWKSPRPTASTVDEQGLTIDPGQFDYAYWYMNGRDARSEWDGSLPVTIEFRMRVRDVLNDSTVLLVADGQRTYQIVLNNGEMKTYRLILKDGMATLYAADSSKVITRTKGNGNFGENHGASAIGPNAIAFGAIRKANRGASEWEFIRWVKDGIFPPLSP